MRPLFSRANQPSTLISRVDPDRDAPRPHPADPPPRLHARAEAVDAGGGGSAGAALLRGPRPARPAPGLPQEPQGASGRQPGRRKPQQLPDNTAGRYSHVSGRGELLSLKGTAATYLLVR